MSAEEANRPALTAKLNDQLRRKGEEGKVFITRGIQALGCETAVQIVAAVREFDEFTPYNDPHSEHDFGTVCFGAHTIHWKIDYYDPSPTYVSEDPADESKTCRVLTIMLSQEH